MSIKATLTSLKVGFTRAESSQQSLQLCPSSDKSKTIKLSKHKNLHGNKFLSAFSHLQAATRLFLRTANTGIIIIMPLSP